MHFYGHRPIGGSNCTFFSAGFCCSRFKSCVFASSLRPGGPNSMHFLRESRRAARKKHAFLRGKVAQGNRKVCIFTALSQFSQNRIRSKHSCFLAKGASKGGRRASTASNMHKNVFLESGDSAPCFGYFSCLEYPFGTNCMSFCVHPRSGRFFLCVFTAHPPSRLTRRTRFLVCFLRRSSKSCIFPVAFCPSGIETCIFCVQIR